MTTYMGLLFSLFTTTPFIGPLRTSSIPEPETPDSLCRCHPVMLRYPEPGVDNTLMTHVPDVINVKISQATTVRALKVRLWSS